MCRIGATIGPRSGGVPKKSKTCDPAEGILIDHPVDRRQGLARQEVRRSHRAKIPQPASGVGRGWPAETFALSVSPMTDVTRILSAIEQGDPTAAEQLLPLVYGELRQLAAQKLTQEKPGQTLQATALVHEAYLRLVDVERAQHWNSRGHFFAAAAEAMRRILVENARRKQRIKHGGDSRRVDLDASCPVTGDPRTTWSPWTERCAVSRRPIPCRPVGQAAASSPG